MTFVAKLTHRPCQDTDFAIFLMAMQKLMNEADKNTDTQLANNGSMYSW